MKDKIGLIFSHIHVRPHEMYKFDMLEYCIDHFDGFDLDFRFVLCGHGVEPPDFIREKIHGIHWETDIDNREIGVGHPKFCIKGYEILIENDITQSLKMRASDLLTNEQEFVRLLGTQKVVFSEQTSVSKGMIGDLFMMGNPKDVLSLWVEKPWNYKHSGLYNLFDNASSKAATRNINIERYLRQNYVFTSPGKIGWMTLDNNWDSENKTIREGFSNKHLWGHMQGYTYYGGFK